MQKELSTKLHNQIFTILAKASGEIEKLPKLEFDEIAIAIDVFKAGRNIGTVGLRAKKQ